VKEFPVKIIDFQGLEIKLNRERWSHIVSRHGELSGMLEEVVETVRDPEEVIQQSDREDTFHYFRSEEKLDYNDYICAVVNTEKEFVVTAYSTDQKS